MEPVFPPELFKEILDHLVASLELSSDSNDDSEESFSPLKAEMKKLSLVCKAFLHFCRPFIFKEVDISLHDGPKGINTSVKRLIRLSQLLKDQPRLAGHVRHIKGFFGDNHSPIPNRGGLFTPLLQLSAVSSIFIEQKMFRRRLDNWDEEKSLPSRASHYDWNFVLGNYLTYTSLTMLNLKFVRAVPLVPILSSPHLQKLVLEGCSINEELRWPTKREVMEGFHLTDFCAKGSTGEIPLDIILLCTDIERVIFDTESDFYFDYHDTPPPIEFDYSNLPFSKLTEAIFAGENFDWDAILKHAKLKGIPALPALWTLGLSLDGFYLDVMDAETKDNCIELVAHAPVLKDLVLCGSAITLILLDELFDEAPCRLTLKYLTVYWDFSYDPDDEDDPTFEVALDGMFLVSLPAVEQIKLSIKLGAGTYDAQKMEAHLTQMTKLNFIFGEAVEKNYPALELLEIIILLDVRKNASEMPEEYEERKTNLKRSYRRILREIPKEATREFDCIFDVRVFDVAL